MNCLRTRSALDLLPCLLVLPLVDLASRQPLLQRLHWVEPPTLAPSVNVGYGPFVGRTMLPEPSAIISAPFHAIRERSASFPPDARPRPWTASHSDPWSGAGSATELDRPPAPWRSTFSGALQPEPRRDRGYMPNQINLAAQFSPKATKAPTMIPR